MKILVSLIPALAYALVSFFSNITGLTSTTPKAQEKKQIVSQPAVKKVGSLEKNFIWAPENDQTISSSADINSSLAWKIPSTLDGMNMQSALSIRRYILSAYATN